MALAPGTKVGPYEIIALLGAGGMGEVYRARDSRLKRDVALKVLPQAFASDAQRMARFEREAQLLAALNHPNIASIYGLEETDSVPALVMELVEGATLAERVTQSSLPLGEALLFARQIAEALEYAHERGIIHRDLKPANIKFAHDASAKVLDFGLAKALLDESPSADISTSPTLSAAATRDGLILGTAAYMSPEQARGKTLDRRADIWSFGCVLFEMLTGSMAFSGETISDTLAAVLTKEPDLGRLPAVTPSGVRRLIEKCLQKDVRKRLQAIGDARIEIEDSLSGKIVPEPHRFPDGEVEKRNSNEWVGVATAVVAILLCVGAAGLVVRWLQGRNLKQQTWTADMIPGPNITMGPRLSPDGHTLAFQAMIDNVTQVAVSSPDSGNWTVLTRDQQHGFVNEISWAPDGSKLYYDRTIATPVGIYSTPALGGGERLVLENAGNPEVLPDGSLIVIHGDNNGRWRIYHYWPDSQRLEPLPGWVSIGTTIPLRVFPDGKEIVFNGSANEADAAVHLYVIDIATGKTRQLAPDLPNRRNNESYPIAPTADGNAVLVDVPAGDLHRIVEIPRDGKGAIRTVMTLTKPPWYMDTAKDGTLYLDQVDRPHEILRFPVSGGQPEVLGSSDTYVPAGQYMEPVETTDGRFLLDTEFSGRGRLLVGKPFADFIPLLDTSEETSSPAASLGNNEVALVLGSGSDAMIVIASATEGRLVRKLKATKGRLITALAASPDAKTLYFGADGFIWAIPAIDGNPQKIGSGDKVTVDPNGRELILTQTQGSNPVLVKVSAAGGKPEMLHVENGQWIAPVPTGARALTRDGKMLVSVSPADSWFYRVGVLDVATGRLTPVRVTYAGDTLSGNWTADGRVISVGLPLKSHVWRFRRAVPD
jgi:eukaryotic-like serine/threonine-protein kinase